MKAYMKAALWIVGLSVGGTGVEIAATSGYDYQTPTVGIWFVTLCAFVALAHEFIGAMRRRP